MAQKLIKYATYSITNAHEQIPDSSCDGQDDILINPIKQVIDSSKQHLKSRINWGNNPLVKHGANPLACLP